MEVREVSRLLDSMCWQKVHQGDAVRVAPIDYNALMLDELEQIENFSPNCKDELNCLSHCIRRYLWKNNTEKLWKLITRLNILTKVLADIFSPEEYWNQNTIIYKKVDENDADGKEKAYKSFQILAKYLEKKGITGIIYPCTRTNRIKGKNVVLFNIHDAVPIIGSITQYHYNGAV